MSDIVERLREYCGSPYCIQLRAEAAAELERLRGEMIRTDKAPSVRIAELEAEIERLRAALRRIISGDHLGSYNGAIDVARRALEGK